tara:strand:+ start:1356 stop:2762 length:1407 start_codon:yes stop_codon:yes gene_type:complete
VKNALYIFTNDLRLDDNLALEKASMADSILAIFIYDTHFGEKPLGAASRLWLHYSLKDLKNQCPELSVYRGNWEETALLLVQKFSISHVFMNHHFTLTESKIIDSLKKSLQKKGCQLSTMNNSLLWEPHHVLKADGTPYRVFTPFYRKGCLFATEPSRPIDKFHASYMTDSTAISIDELGLLPRHSWGNKVLQHWDISTAGGEKTLNIFLDKGIKSYKEGRNQPALDSVSRLSPYIHFGNISIRKIWHAAKKKGNDKNIDHFLSELGWREFSYSLLHHFPKMTTENLQEKFNQFPWEFNKKYYTAWKRGLTGYPLVDAGMRELWETGYMHNRIRMVVGSFLVKNLLIDWRYGEKWFWDCLVDADIASNTASWQWIAGCGADAAPYFRVFNPVTQGHKFDPDGDYTLRYLPELAKLPKKYLFSPWEAPLPILEVAGVTLGETYPFPIVDLKLSRENALAAFASLKREDY